MVALVWAYVVSDHEAVVAGVVFGNDTVTGATLVTPGVGISAVLFFVHVEPVLVTAPIAPAHVVVGLIGDVMLRADNLAITRSLFQVNQPWLTTLRALMKSLLSTRESPLLWQS